MKIIELKQLPEIQENVKLKEAYTLFEKLLSELRKRDLPDGLVMSFNKYIEELNSASISADEMRKKIEKTQSEIIRLLEKEVKLVPKNYYRNIWLALGIAVFGIPIGIVFGAILENMTFLAIGLPIGLVIGVAVGAGMDNKAGKEGRQLDVEI